MAERITKWTAEIHAKEKGVKETTREVGDFAKEIKKLDAAIKKNVQGQKIMRKEIERLEDSGKALSDEWIILHKSLDKSGESLKKQRGLIDRYADGMDDAEQATEEQRKELDKLKEATDEHVKVQAKLNEEVKEGKEALDGEKRAADKLATEMAELARETDESVVAARANVIVTQKLATEEEELGRAVNEATEKKKARRQVDRELTVEVERLSRATDGAVQAEKAKKQIDYELLVSEERLARGTQFLGLSMDDLKKSLISGLAIGGAAGLVFKGLNLITDGLRRAAQAAVEFQKASIETFTNLQEEVARAKAQIGDLNQSQEVLYRGAVTYSRELARGPVETQLALRKAMNLGLDYNESLQAIEASSNAARVAGSDMTDTLITAVSTVNAYGQGVYDVNEVLDQYAYITQNSNLETQDLISGMAKIISPAAEAGVSLEEVAAAMVVMNRQGDDFQEIGELLGNLLTQIAIGGTTLGEAFQEAAGMGFREFTAAGGTLVEGLMLIEDHADLTEQSISELVIGSSKFYRDMQAGRGVLELTGRHTKELTEANVEAAASQGALNEQIGEFTGTLYLANQELESAKLNAQAAEGSLTSMAAIGWTEFKTDLYDTVAGLSTQIALTDQLTEAVKRSTQGYGVLHLQHLSISALQKDYGNDIITAELASFELQREILRLLEENKDLSLEDLEIALIELQILEHEVNLENAIKDARQKSLESGIQSQRVREMEAGLAQEMAVQAEIEAEAAERALLADEAGLAAMEYRLIVEGQANALRDEGIAKALEFRQMQAGIYTESQNVVQSFIDLNEQLGLATDDEDIVALTTQIEELGEALGEEYRNATINAMLANDGYNESITDLAVEMGLLTAEAGELQKEYIRTKTEAEALADIEGFDAFSTKAQAAAIGEVADGIATAAEAYAKFDPANWKEGVAQGIVRAEELFMIEPEVVIPQDDQDLLDELEAQLQTLKETEWKTTVTAYLGSTLTDVGMAQEALDKLEDKQVTITVTTVYKEVRNDDDPDDSAATGADFTVPAGYQNDNFWLGLTSGEKVTVTPPGLGSGGGGAVEVSVVNNFSSGTHNPTNVAAAVDDGLYQALLKAGLI